MENFKNCAESLVQIYQNYDILFLDAYGVLKAENGKLFPLVPELLSLMKNNGKKIYIISNSSQNSEILKKSYASCGLLPSLYDGVVSSGDMLNHWLTEKKLPLNGNKFYIFGKPHSSIFRFAIEKYNLDVRSRFAMVGDQFVTDMLGAINAHNELKLKIDPVLVIGQGLANQSRLLGKSLEDFCQGQCRKIVAISKIAAL